MREPTERAAIDAVLDLFHAAAADADEERYFATLAPSAVFLGTAGGERWTGGEFRDFVRPYFSRGKGWAYTPSNRSVEIAADGQTAWFDEELDNDFYGECRGTGVLQRYGGEWKIEQYNLAIPIPNEVAEDVVAMIRRLQ